MSDELIHQYSPSFAPFFGFAGCASAIVLSALGAAIGTVKSGIGIAGIATFKPDLIMKSLIPVVMSGILAVYGLVVAVLVAGGLSPTADYTLFNGFLHLASGLCVGFSCLSSGYAIGIVGDVGVRKFMHQPRLFVGIVLILIFAEVLGLYGMIIALILNTRGSGN
ncbi:HER131Wp [Eremothecium sinecaudum]|uniref:V-type proton ATPase proteolipid subunit n=1 Tax=Eremothecium sinecaudum TaxID=45286 RepID=A0A0X8HU17_9SACH|nr:HER131Wp [Eremothecium sinecaudum]AMD21410.1 HER131Wp [Eremothecium sinecaudum]